MRDDIWAGVDEGQRRKQGLRRAPSPEARRKSGSLEAGARADLGIPNPVGPSCPPGSTSLLGKVWSLASPGSWSEMQHLRPHPDPQNEDLHFKSAPMTWVCVQVQGALSPIKGLLGMLISLEPCCEEAVPSPGLYVSDV